VLALAMFIAVFAAPPAAAGSGTGSSSPRSTAGTILDLVKEAWSEDPALVALRARDKGYSTEQTLEAMADEELAADGTVTDDGRPAAPDEPPAGVLAREGETEVLTALDRNQRRLTKPKFVDPPAEYEDGIFMLVVLISLMAEGYTVEQIILDGLAADGIRNSGPYAPMVIVDADGKKIDPEAGPIDEPSYEGVVRDMITLAQGEDPLDPDFKPQYDATYAANVTVSGATMRVTAKGKLGASRAAGGDAYLGRLTGTIDVPAGDRCPGEKVPIVIGLTGLEVEGRAIVEMDQTWAYAGGPAGGSTGGSSGAICIAAAEAPELVGAIGDLLGVLRGPVRNGATLESSAGLGTSKLTLKARR
jgi:hypothetical protein